MKTFKNKNNKKMKKFILLLSLIFLASGGVAFAETIYSPALSTSKIEINEVLKKGQKADLPVITIHNRNEERMFVEMEPIYVSGQEGKEVPEDWIQFIPKNFSLGSGETKNVKVKIRIPKDRVDNGNYKAYLKASARISEDDSTKLVPSVATPLTFSVEGRFTWRDWFGKWFANRRKGLASIGEYVDLNYLVIFMGIIIVALISWNVVDKIKRRKKQNK